MEDLNKAVNAMVDSGKSESEITDFINNYAPPKKAKGVVKQNANATPAKTTVSKSAISSSESKNNPFGNTESWKPDFQKNIEKVQPKKNNAPPIQDNEWEGAVSYYGTRKPKPNIELTPGVDDFGSVVEAENNAFDFKNAGVTPAFKEQQRIKTAKAKVLKEADDATWRKAREHHYTSNKQWKEDEATLAEINAVDEDKVNEDVADEENQNQFTDWAKGAAKGTYNVGAGLLNIVPKAITALSGGAITTGMGTLDPYAMGKEVKPFDAFEDKAEEQIRKKELDTYAGGGTWKEPTEDERQELKRNLFIDSKRKDQIKSNYRELFSPGYLDGGESIAEKKKIQDRLKVHQIQSINNLDDDQKINAAVTQNYGDRSVNLQKDILYDKHLIESGQASQDIIDGYASKVEKFKSVDKYYKDSLNTQKELGEKQLTSDESLQLFKLNYEPWGKMVSDVKISFGTPVGGTLNLIGIDAGKQILEGIEYERNKYVQYDMSGINSAADLGGYVTQTLAGLLPYMVAPQVKGAYALAGKLAMGTFATGAMGEKKFQMDEEMLANPSLNYSDAQYAAAMALAGGANLLMQKGVHGILKGSAPTVSKVFADPLQKEAFKASIKGTIEKAVAQLPKAGKFLKEVNQSGITGLGVSTMEVFSDNEVLGKKTDVTDALVSGYANFAILHGAMHAVPAVLGYGLGKIRDTKDNFTINKNNATIKNINIELANADINPTTKGLLKSQIADLELSNKKIFQRGIDRVGLFTSPQIKDLFNIDQEKIGIKNEYQDLLKDKKNLSKEIFDKSVSDLEKRFNESENKKSKIFEKTSSLDYIKDQSAYDLLQDKAKQSLESDNATGKGLPKKVNEETIRERMAEMNLIETKMVENSDAANVESLKKVALKNLQRKVTDKQKEEGFGINDFDILKETQKVYVEKIKFENSLEGAYSNTERSNMWDLSVKKKDIEYEIKELNKDGKPVSSKYKELQGTVNEIINKTGIAKKVAEKMTNEMRNLTKLERQVYIIKHLTKDDVRSGAYEDHFGDNTPTQSFQTTEDYQKAYNEYTDRLGKAREDVSGRDAEFLDNGQILINLEVAKQTGQINAGGHELLHKVLQGAFAHNSKVIKANLIAQVTAGEITLSEAKSKIAKETAIHEERMDDLVESFKSAIGEDAQKLIQNRIDRNYRYVFYSKEDYAKLEKNEDPSLDNYIGIEDLGNGQIRAEVDASSYRQEWITGFSDALVRKQIKDGLIIKVDGKSKINWEKIGDALKLFTKKETGLDLDFKDGKDIVNFVKDYNKNLAKARISSRAKGMIDAGIALGLKEGGSKKSKSIDERRSFLEQEMTENRLSWDDFEKQMDALDKEEINGIIEDRPKAEKVNGEESVRTKKDVTVDEKKLGNEIDALVGPRKADGKYEMTKDQWDKGGILKAKNKLVDGNILEPLIRKELTRNGVTSDNVHGVPIDLFFEDVKNRVLEAALLKFDPEKNNSLGGYIIGSQFGIKNRVGDIANRYKKLLGTESIDVESRSVGAIHELASEEQADYAFDEAIVEEGPKYVPLINSNIVKPEVLESITNKTLLTLRTIKSKVEAPKQNVMVSPFIKEIREEIGSQVDIDLKTAMGGKKNGELVSWLLNAKKSVLENMTTTWLMGKEGEGGIPQAIQKRVDGQWRNFPDWVGQKIDRESTSEDLAGRTAGHELVRRLPNAAEVIPDEVYLGQVVDKTGNPIRGRKESLAKAVGQEMTFELISKDLREGGPIYEAVSKNQEMLNNVLGDNAIADILNQIDRGNTKHSSSVEELGDAELNSTDRNEVRAIRRNTRQAFMDFVRNYDGKVYDDIKLFLAGNNNVPLAEELKDNLRVLRKNIIDAKNIMVQNKVNKAVGSKQQILGSNLHEKQLEKALETYKDNKELGLAQILSVVKAEHKAYKTSNGFLVTTNPQYVENTLKRHLNGQNYPELFSENGFSTVTREEVNENGQVETRNSLLFNGERIDNYYNVTTKKSNLLNSKDPNKTRSNIDKEAETNSKYIVDWAIDAKKNELSDADVNGYLSMMSGDQESALSRASKLGFHITGKPVEETTFEHNTPKAVLSKAVKDFISGKINQGELESIFDNSRINLVDKKMDQALTKEGLKSKGEERHMNDMFIKNLIPYIDAKKVEGLDKVYDINRLNAEVKRIKELDPEVIKKENELIDAILKTNSNSQKSISDKEENKGISVLDFDDTVGLTKSNVLYTMPNGKSGKLTGEGFAKQGVSLLDKGAKFDFSEFSKVVDGKPGPMFEKLQKLIGKFGTKDMYILTARPADSARPIKEFLNSLGVDIPLENITGLGNSSPQAKADWMVGKVAEGYNDFYFADDHLPNVNAVKETLEAFDVKSKVQQARKQFSLSMSEDFNKIIEENKGMEHYKVFSDVVARRRGANKNKFDFYVPPSAADFELLLYNFMGKGQRGEEHAKFFDDALLKPYAAGIDLMDSARQSIKRDYKALGKSFPGVKEKLESLTPDGDFTYDQALRVAMWKEADVAIPGLSERDGNKLTDLVNNDPELSAFKNGLIITGRQGTGWLPPQEHWDSQTIISDLHNVTEGVGRKKFLGEFIDNTENIFGKFDNGKLTGPNMNKIEAVYGTNVREALEDSIYRMTNGKNRSYGKDKETSAWSNWVNGSTGTIMFLNTRSAVLQLIGSVNFLNLRDNNPIMAAKAFANQPQYWKDFAHIWNSDKLKERRGGLKDDVSAAEIANAAEGSKNKPAAVVSYLLKIGYAPTQIADAMAIAGGGAPYYRNRINSYVKEGLSIADAEKAAWSDFSKVSDETQQSGDPRDISKQQASGAGRLILAFQNTSMQQSRIIKKSYLDLKNGRGDAITHIAKIGYYLAVQNTMFAALQSGLFALAFDDEEDENSIAKKKEDKAIDIGNSVLDSILRGTGFGGAIVATLKNIAKKYLDEKDKKFKADYAKVVLEAVNISPPIGSKASKLYSAFQSTKFDKDVIDKRGWDVMQDGRVHLSPSYSIAGKMAEVGLNLPMNRLVTKINNVSEAINSQNKAWQRVMVGLGYTPYSIGIKNPGDEKIKAEGKAVRKEEGKVKAKITRMDKQIHVLDSLSSLPQEEYDKYLKVKKINSEIKRLENRIKKDSIANLAK
jgi:hypothetical protein